MPSKTDADVNLWFLYVCLQKSDYKTIDFNAVAEAANLNAPAARMRFTRLKKAIENGIVNASASPTESSGFNTGSHSKSKGNGSSTSRKHKLGGALSKSKEKTDTNYMNFGSPPTMDIAAGFKRLGVKQEPNDDGARPMMYMNCLSQSPNGYVADDDDDIPLAHRRRLAKAKKRAADTEAASREAKRRATDMGGNPFYTGSFPDEIPSLNSSFGTGTCGGQNYGNAATTRELDTNGNGYTVVPSYYAPPRRAYGSGPSLAEFRRPYAPQMLAAQNANKATVIQGEDKAPKKGLVPLSLIDPQLTAMSKPTTVPFSKGTTSFGPQTTALEHETKAAATTTTSSLNEFHTVLEMENPYAWIHHRLPQVVITDTDPNAPRHNAVPIGQTERAIHEALFSPGGVFGPPVAATANTTTREDEGAKKKYLEVPPVSLAENPPFEQSASNRLGVRAE